MNPLLFAEQAVLGAVLLDPGQLAQLEWLEPDHFYRPVHQALFTALRKLRAEGHPAVDENGAVPLSWVTDAVSEASVAAPGMSAPYAFTLVSVCPRPRHAPVYGRMVLEGAIHRSVTEHATRLHHAAHTDALQGEVEETLHYADVLRGVLSDLARRWGSEQRPVAPAGAPAVVPVAPPPTRVDQVADDERFLLAVLVERPAEVDTVVGWLRPGDFADPAHGQIYRCLGSLHHRGEPIDRITVLWEAQRRGWLTDGTLTTEQLSEICDGVGPGSAEWLGEQVLRSTITRTAAASARTIRALAQNESLAPGRLISHALHALGPLDEVRARWRAVKNPEPLATAPTTPESSTARIQAALARSAPRPAARPPDGSGPTTGSTAARRPTRAQG